MVINQKITEDYAIYESDNMEVLPEIKSESIHLSVYSPPFNGLYHYSSSERDLSNCKNYDEFFAQYEFTVKELFRITMPGRATAVHCCDLPLGNSGGDFLRDFGGDIIRLHQKNGFNFKARHCIWKEPLGVRNRTMAKDLAHKTVIDDSMDCGVANADFLLIFVKDGKNKIPVAHPVGLLDYAGERKIPANLLPYRGYVGDQKENVYSHWIWRQYASSNWDDIRIDNVLPFKLGASGKLDENDEKHVHPLQLDVIERCVIMRSNPGEKVLTPYMGVGSEVYGAVKNGRKGIGIELKHAYYIQSERNLQSLKNANNKQLELVEGLDNENL
jgi:DNA modification methylase